MKPLPRGLLAAAAGALALLTLGLARLTDGITRPLPRTGPISLLVLAAGVFLLTRSLRARLAGAPGTRPIIPTGVARALAVGRAAAIVGIVAVGAWAGLAVDRVFDLGSLNSARGDLFVSLGGAAGAVLLVLAGLALEDACRAPR